MIEKSVYLDALNKNKCYIVNYSMITTCLPVDGDISGELDIIRGTVTVPV